MRSWGGNVGPLLDVLECYVDGAADVAELVAACDAMRGRGDGCPFGVSQYDFQQIWQTPDYVAKTMVHHALDDLRRTRGEEQSVGPQDAAWESISNNAKAEVAEVVRDVFGNPFRPSTRRG